MSESSTSRMSNWAMAAEFRFSVFVTLASHVSNLSEGLCLPMEPSGNVPGLLEEGHSKTLGSFPHVKGTEPPPPPSKEWRQGRMSRRK